MKRHYIIPLVSLLLQPYGHLTAQSGSEASKNVSVEFSVIGWGGRPNGLSFKDGNNKEPLDIQAFRRSPTYKYSGPFEMPLFWSAKEAIAKQEELIDRLESYGEPGAAKAIKKTMPSIKAGEDTSNDPVGYVEFPIGAKKATVLLAQIGEKKYKTIVINDDLDHFPSGQIRMVNMTNRRIAIRYDKKEAVILAPKEDRIIAPEDIVLFAQIVFEFEEESRWVMLKETRIPVPDGYQTTIFFLQSNETHFKTLDGQTVDPIQSFTVYDKIEKQ